MHRDMKVGLSMGLLLVGIVGALFFRRGPEKPGIPPPPESVALLDEQIADNANVPYDLGQPEIPAPAPAMSSAPPSGFVSQSAQGAATSAATAQMDSRPPSPAPIGAASPDAAPAGTLPPSVEPNVAAVIPPPAPPAHNNRWEPIPAGASRAPATAAKSGATHVVSKGDTLSTIASQHLGDQSRYREIYEANRSQMKSPNDLREGMTLQIPGGSVPPASLADRDSPAKPQTGVHSVSDRATITKDSAIAEPASQTPEPGSAPAFTHDQSGSRRFIAVPRGPFSAGRVAPGSTPAKSAERVPATRLDDPATKPSESKSVEGTLPHISSNEAESLINGDGPGGRRRPLRYRVRKGETLEQIAARFYGDKAKAQKILDANRELLPTRSALRNGMELLLPPND
jgi:nucleoid-associated protein YgaU